MSRKLIAIFFLLFSGVVQANDLEDADKAWKDGQPWPSHWGMITYPYKEGWNVVFMGYVHKIYGEGEASNTWLKDIPAAMPKGAAVEICVMKRGLLKLATICKDALVDKELVGTLKEDDVVAAFYGNHKTTIFSDGPGADPRAAMRVFQKITDAGDDSCWERRVMLFYGPISKACFNKIDTERVGQILSRDFGPKEGSGAYKALSKPADDSVRTISPDEKHGSEIAERAGSKPTDTSDSQH
jgi:hypothetical protein